MKKFLALFLALFSITLICSCDEIQEPQNSTNDNNKNNENIEPEIQEPEIAGFNLTYQDGDNKTKVFIKEGEKVTEPTAPKKDGYTFIAWYEDKTFTKKYKFNNELKEDKTIYAKWGKVIPNIEDIDSLEIKDITTLDGVTFLDNLSQSDKKQLSHTGYGSDYIGDFSKYIGTSYYRKVSTPEEFLKAIVDAKPHYSNVWNTHTETYDQVFADGYNESNYQSKVHIIEITSDLDLGYFNLSDAAKKTGVVSDFASNLNKLSESIYVSDMVKENGISQIKIENISDLLIYSKNGAKITHAGFKLNSTDNIVIRNLEFDELWQWEDAPLKSTTGIGDYDFFGWAYFKIAFSGYIWIDHCKFGKSYDGQIDYANPVYNVQATCFRAPYRANGKNGLHISWCNFNAGSDDEDGYLYKMMKSIEEDYLKESTDCLYYKTLRNAGASFEDILYGLAMPQKKGFLLGDNSSDDKKYNPQMNVSFANCVFKNIEDRLPKLRGGDCYMYNCLIDSSQYYEYRDNLTVLNAKKVIEGLGWKCALVSQGLVPSQSGSVMAENCIYRGILYFIKNNDSGTGCYQFKNCTYQLSNGDIHKINTTDDIDVIAQSQSEFLKGSLEPDQFNWNTDDGNAPFTVTGIDLNVLENYLYNSTFGVGININFKELFTKTIY